MPRSRQSPRYAALCAMLMEARQEAGLTQVALAKQLGRPQSYVSKVEDGERRVDVIEFLEFTEAVGCNAAELIKGLLAVTR